MSIGSTPYNEDCAQLGSEIYDYRIMAKLECIAFIEQLKRLNGTPPDGVSFRITSNPHDFGSYLDVTVIYDEDDETQSDYAYKCEEGLDNWDIESLDFLRKNNYSIK
jgi:hypothetical protein